MIREAPALSAVDVLRSILISPGMPGFLDQMLAEHPPGDDCPGCADADVVGPCPVRPLAEWASAERARADQ